MEIDTCGSNFLNNDNEIKYSKIQTRGDGAGGSNTNKNGLSFEHQSNFAKHFTIFETHLIENKEYHVYHFDGIKIIHVEKKCLEKVLKNDFQKLEKSLQPDEAFIDIESKKLFILEKKYQQNAGSVDEKIQTGLFKKEFYQELYPTYKIHYAYVFNDWFKNEKYKPELRFLTKYGVQVFWNSDEDYFEQIKNWITNDVSKK